MASFDAQRAKLSYNAKLPSISCGRDLLLVGPSRLTQPLASALLQVQFDRRNGTDAAIEALRKHCFHYPPKRTIHTVESLQDKSWKFRLDHIFLLTTQQQLDETKLVANQLLQDDYLLFQRVTIVQVHECGGEVDQPRKKSKIETIPVFHLQLENPMSQLTIARMLLQRTKLGTRKGNPTMPHISPLIFGNY
jgi:hypothetical protein